MIIQGRIDRGRIGDSLEENGKGYLCIELEHMMI